jgi:hypothetical protein
LSQTLRTRSTRTRALPPSTGLGDRFEEGEPKSIGAILARLPWLGEDPDPNEREYEHGDRDGWDPTDDETERYPGAAARHRKFRALRGLRPKPGESGEVQRSFPGKVVPIGRTNAL